MNAHHLPFVRCAAVEIGDGLDLGGGGICGFRKDCGCGRSLRLVLPAGQPVEPKVTLTLRPAAELWMQLEERQ
jgi:hypothetical protein